MNGDLLQASAWTMLVCGAVVFITFIVTPLKACYGRYGDSCELPFARVLVPVRLAWFLQELPSFLFPLYYFLQCTETVNRIILGMFLLHYTQRALVYPLLIRGGKATPLPTFTLALLFCAWNGWTQGSYHSRRLYPPDFVASWTRIAGVAMFLAGMLLNLHSDHILRNLRKENETGYKIPHGGLFSWVSGANFLGEIIEWIGFAIVAGSLPSLAFAFFTFANTGPRACQHHRWYQSKFPDYPWNRKALIPFLL